MGKLGLRHLFLAKKTRFGSITRAHDKVGLVAGVPAKDLMKAGFRPRFLAKKLW